MSVVGEKKRKNEIRVIHKIFVRPMNTGIFTTLGVIHLARTQNIPENYYFLPPDFLSTVSCGFSHTY